MKKLLAKTLALVLALSAFTACGDSGSSSDGASSSADSQTSSASEGGDASSGDDTAANSDLKAPVADGAIDITQGMTENMLTRSIHFEGDTTRLANKLKEAKENQDKTCNIVFLGDSITAGSSAAGTKYNFVGLFTEWWKTNYNKKTVVTNAGIGATNTYFGVHRTDRDVLSYEPDIIFIEFINDSGDMFYQKTTDSLVRKCLAYKSNPAVVLVEMSLEGGGNAHEQHVPVAEKYGVPVLSYHDAIYPEVEAGNINFKSSAGRPGDKDGLSPDGTHPNNAGHAMVAQMIENFIDKVAATADSAGEITPFDPESESLTGDIYKNAHIVDTSTPDEYKSELKGFAEESTPWNFQNGWSASKAGDTMTFEMEFRNLGMLYYKTVKGETGSVEVSVDGGDGVVVNGDFPNGWGDYTADTEIYTSDESAKHTVTVKVLDGDKTNFEVHGWLVS
ncbi:MAG: SGNH/GDSL hydrolase family protein [Ruminococcus sp.]|nr:SGNH/GDSL hydrolase family protein [Ruminococcus sp.]